VTSTTEVRWTDDGSRPALNPDEPVRIQALSPGPAIERFDERIVCRLSGP